MAVTTADASEGLVTFPAGGIVTFTTANWNMPKTITITGQDDDIIDGNQVFDATISAASSTDGDYDGFFGPTTIQFTNIDDDKPGITVGPQSSAMISETGTTFTFPL